VIHPALIQTTKSLECILMYARGHPARIHNTKLLECLLMYARSHSARIHTTKLLECLLTYAHEDIMHASMWPLAHKIMSQQR
jgi:hypothetical protein